ncbi:MAG: DNA adenine methylase [Armatimonadota bacterium]
MKLKSPIPYFGGKQHLAAKLIPLFPSHITYIEPFGGAGALLFAKKPSPIEVYNDVDADLVNFMEVLRDRDGKFPEFYQRACLSPYSRDEWEFCRDHLNDDPNPVERARRFFVVARFSFSGLVGKSFAVNITNTRGGMVQKASAYQGVLGMLPCISERLMTVLIEHRDFRDLIRRYDSPNTFFYLDPPYLPETRRSGSYRYEMTTQDHQELIELLKSLKGKAMLSGYPHVLYDSLGWNKLSWAVCCHAGGGTQKSRLQSLESLLQAQQRTEGVWMNY